MTDFDSGMMAHQSGDATETTVIQPMSQRVTILQLETDERHRDNLKGNLNKREREQIASSHAVSSLTWQVANGNPAESVQCSAVQCS